MYARAKCAAQEIYCKLIEAYFFVIYQKKKNVTFGKSGKNVINKKVPIFQVSTCAYFKRLKRRIRIQER